MRIKTVKLAWFRGAADPASLDADAKSIVIYGENGAGKSSFVDAIEYVLKDGKIGHLAHEYSGKHQEKAVSNTHKPPDRKTEISIRFRDDSELRIDIAQNGTSTRTGAETVAMHTWDYRRTVLRQNEVANFVHDTKGGKYSALLPLLGLHPMEIAAENLRRLAKAVEQESKLKELKGELKEVETRRKVMLGSRTDEQILERAGELHAKYCPDKAATKDSVLRCEEVKQALDARIARFSAEQRRYLALRSVAELTLQANIDAVRTASVKLASAVEPFIEEKLTVLESAEGFVARLKEEKEVQCPACGQLIPVDAFQKHVRGERERLQDILEAADTRKAAIVTLCDTIKSLKTSLSKVELKDWRDELAKGPLAGSLEHLQQLEAEGLRKSCHEENLADIEGKLLPLAQAAAVLSEDAPLDVQDLSNDRQTVQACQAVMTAKELAAAAARAEALASFLGSLEQGIRDEIRERCQAVLEGLSTDIQAMWKILHPGEAIENTSLYLPKDADKAIDIALRFHGVQQDSPRLTLSEGYRNSLGLCIFLAMAKREADGDRPLFLDDVVVSLDRQHRGMVAELLEKEFGERQVVVLTHDREWFTELRHQLDGNRWGFRALLPYESPTTGIRWSHKTTTFEDARAHLKTRPDSAGNDARKIMDVELAIIAERLQLPLPYLRADRNDKRMAHEFLERLIADGRKSLQKKGEKDYVVHEAAIEALDLAQRLLVSWANRASHSFDVARSEATKLIDACERALDLLKCSSCSKGVWFAEVKGTGSMQCHCGALRWR